MDLLPGDVLSDPSYRVPAAPAAAAGMAWLRHHVVRFCEGETHQHRRALMQALIDGITDAPFVETPTISLLTALGLPGELAADVALASAAYQAHAPQSAEADAAADRLVAAAGGRTEAAAAVVCVLVQADAACTVLTDRIRTGSSEPPLAATRRVAPDGTVVAVDLTDAHFGRGTHRCPGEALAVRLCTEAAEPGAEASDSGR